MQLLYVGDDSVVFPCPLMSLLFWRQHFRVKSQTRQSTFEKMCRLDLNIFQSRLVRYKDISFRKLIKHMELFSCFKMDPCSRNADTSLSYELEDRLRNTHERYIFKYFKTMSHTCTHSNSAAAPRPVHHKLKEWICWGKKQNWGSMKGKFIKKEKKLSVCVCVIK